MPSLSIALANEQLEAVRAAVAAEFTSLEHYRPRPAPERTAAPAVRPLCQLQGCGSEFDDAFPD
ncbi:hypothetical protein ACFQ6Q_30885, partial [Streptomyces sp. NPDC056437]|uniref:hypothetical protein n=1 Tax=Streptomyces sp. NPDC056437 TaxID=3345816 RepID=UPI00367D62F0